MIHHLGQVKLQSIFIVIIQVSSGELSCHGWTSLRVQVVVGQIYLVNSDEGVVD